MYLIQRKLDSLGPSHPASSTAKPHTQVFIFLSSRPPQVAITLSNLAPRQHLPVSGRAGRRAVCDLPARTQQPSDLPLRHPLPDEEPQLRGPARGAGGAAALAHALRSLGPGHRSPQREIRRGRSVSPIPPIKRGEPHRPKRRSSQSLCNFGAFFFSFLRRLQQRGMSEDGGVLRPQRGPLDVHCAHADSEGSVPDGCSHGREKFPCYFILNNNFF